MGEYVKLIYDGKEYELPLIVGYDGNKAIDISKLRAETGLITYDQGYGNTGSCKSAITYLDGERGILRYRGIPVEQLAEQSTFVETAYLLIHSRLPTQKELNRFRVMLNDQSLVHEDLQYGATPMPPTVSWTHRIPMRSATRHRYCHPRTGCRAGRSVR